MRAAYRALTALPAPHRIMAVRAALNECLASTKFVKKKVKERRGEKQVLNGVNGEVIKATQDVSRPLKNAGKRTEYRPRERNELDAPRRLYSKRVKPLDPPPPRAVRVPGGALNRAVAEAGPTMSAKRAVVLDREWNTDKVKVRDLTRNQRRRLIKTLK